MYMVSEFDDTKLRMTNGWFEQGKLNALKQYIGGGMRCTMLLIL